MATIEELRARREKLVTMRTAGTASVRDGDRSVSFRSDAEIAALEGRMPVRQVRIWADKGL